MNPTATQPHDMANLLACPQCEDTGPFWACVVPACPVVECSECGMTFRADTGGTGDTTCLADRMSTAE